MPGDMMTWAKHPTPDDMHENFRHSVDDRNIRFRMFMDNGDVWNYHDSRTWGKLQLVEGVSSILDDEQIARYGPDWVKSPHEALDAIVDHRSRRAAKDVLTDQNVSAGVGNYLAVEAMHRAGVYPRTSWSELGRNTRWLIGEMLRELIDESFNSSNHSHWRIFEKRGQLCPSCEQGIIEYVKDGASAKRGSYYCPICQPRSSS